MTNHTVVPFPARRAAGVGYTDTAALNDIHAILCRRGGWDPTTLDDIAEVLTRRGRPVVDICDIDAAVTETPAGLPEARVDAGDTTVRVYQDQTGGLVVAIASDADPTDLIVTLNERRLRP